MTNSNIQLIIFIALVVLGAWWLFFYLPKAIKRDNEKWQQELADSREERSRPFLVVAVNGETALVERWDGKRFSTLNPFDELYSEMLVELTWNGDTIIDYIDPEVM